MVLANYYLLLSYTGGFPADVIYIHNKSAGINLEIAFRVIALQYSTAEFLHNGSHILAASDIVNSQCLQVCLMLYLYCLMCV